MTGKRGTARNIARASKTARNIIMASIATANASSQPVS